MTEGLGSKPFHRKVAVLINEHTLSAGEMVAAFIAENRLATLVGTRTGGQVLGGGNFTVGHGFVLRLPAAAWYTWRGAVVEGWESLQTLRFAYHLPLFEGDATRNWRRQSRQYALNDEGGLMAVDQIFDELNGPSLRG